MTGTLVAPEAGELHLECGFFHIAFSLGIIRLHLVI
jgi:hypothetical protein